MEEVVTRPRYGRSHLPAKRRKRNVKETNDFFQKIIGQLILSILLLAVIGIIKSINSPPTNFATEKIKAVLFQNIDLKEVYTGIEGFFSKILGSKTEDGENAVNTDTLSQEGSTAKEADKGAGVSQQGMDNETISAILKAHAFINPVEGAVSSPFGERIHPLTKVPSFHNGVDLEANKGDQIKAVLAGVVSQAGSDVTYGNYIKLKHNDGLETVYAHCSQLLVKQGDKIKQGDIIAKVGDTGLSVGAHLHFEVWINNKVYNPMSFIKGLK